MHMNNINIQPRELSLDEIEYVSGGFFSADPDKPKTKDNPDGYIPEITTTAPRLNVGPSFSDYMMFFGGTSGTSSSLQGSVIVTVSGVVAEATGSISKSKSKQKTKNTFTCGDINQCWDHYNKFLDAKDLYNPYEFIQ